MSQPPAAFPDPRTLLKKHGLMAKKSWGQNFLVSQRVYRAIVDATVTSDENWVVEIGAGLGTLTARLAERVPEGKVIAIERDRDMVAVLEQELGQFDNVEIHPANALTYDFAGPARWAGAPIAVVGNLPYQIASQILFRIVEHSEHITHAIVMLQREMADRIVSPPGNRSYGALSVLMQAHCEASIVVRAKPGDFTPAPRVDSAVLRLAPHSPPRIPASLATIFSQVVHAAFAQRRKTIRNSLRATYGDDTPRALDIAQLDGQRRAETLSVKDFIVLTNAFCELGYNDADPE